VAIILTIILVSRVRAPAVALHMLVEANVSGHYTHHYFSSLSLLLSESLTFLPERGISEQTVENKSFKVDKVRPPKKISAQSERARARPKTCALGPFLIKRGISEKTVKNKSLKVDKVRPPKYFFFFFDNDVDNVFCLRQWGADLSTLETLTRKFCLHQWGAERFCLRQWGADISTWRSKGGGEFRVLACADTGSETPLGVRQYWSRECVRQRLLCTCWWRQTVSGHYTHHYYWSSGVRAPAVDLHMLVEANVSGHYTHHYFSRSLLSLRVPHFSPRKRHF
jgi:hypothetical protein